ncbi:hypothetical protein SARC_02587 [Sphaeroforma arctica JP610]|uniref:peptidylprolyl isomerase n=1 Tax=Sphaeroforma arctica JP610 TaxID=667725 RepID=A0A0L0G8H6_9EUKA|nr:hypothetical protein SARC_02587 [Sphaeroforma arctica JP610]KNC85209.1 hypothetical protein SARC_02587 [Sphaeroforma arctica JP610]|eukprot:XP_014159111.1 hypothetical protein SARC_02587 [Sphaeroforma arctica JP610]
MIFVNFVLAVLAICSSSVLAGPKEDGIAFLEANKAQEGVIELNSGLQYKVLNKGSGLHHPTVSSPCMCHYHGTLIDGTVFDSSVDRGTPIKFAPNQVIAGWTEAMQLMVEGDKFELYIPSELAYGERGSGAKIPGGAALVFTIEMLEILGDKVDAWKCNVVTKEHCTDRENTYIDKMSAKGIDDNQKELERVTKINKGKLKPELKNWNSVRIKILEGLATPKSENEAVDVAESVDSEGTKDEL